MRTPPRVIAIDDEQTHLAGLANSLAWHGIPCFQIPFTGDSSTDDFTSIPTLPNVALIFADLHLGGGALGSDHMTDFSTIGALLEDGIKPCHSYVILLWTAYPDQASGLYDFLGERLHSVTKPSGVIPLAKANHLDQSGNVKDAKKLVKEIVDITESVPGIGALLDPDGRTPETTPGMMEEALPDPETIRQRLTRLFEKRDGPHSTPPPGFPQWETTMEEWMDIMLPDFGSTPRQMLRSGDEGALALLNRFVNAIATSRALSHPHLVRDIVRHRMKALYGKSREEDWMDLPNPLLGNVTPRHFFEDDDVDAELIQKVSSLLDSIDDGAFS